MKPLSAFVLLVFASFFEAEAQMPIVLSDDSLQIGNSRLPAISVDIPEVDYDKTLKTWIGDLQSGTKSKVVTDNNEMSIFGARLKTISTDPVNVYSTLTRFDQVLRLSAAFELKKDLYVEKAAGEAVYIKAQSFLKEFAKARYVEFAKAEADMEEKKLRDLQKELSSLEKEKSKMRKTIQSDNTSILREKENIVAQNNELTSVADALEVNNRELATMEPGPAQKEKQVYIKELEKRQKKALSSVKSSEKKINNANSKIKNANQDIPRNEKLQDKVKEQIAQQETVFQKYSDKLKKIRSY